MRIFVSFLVVFISVILLNLPLTGSIYDFRTDQRADTFTVTTAVGVTSTNVTLLKALYDNDTTKISYASNIAEVPVFVSYNTTTRQLTTGGLTDNTSRTLEVSYDVSALSGAGAIDGLIDKVPFVWLLMVIVLPVAAIVAVFLGKA